ncbi:MAG: germination protein YpeB [Clostridia bacterium]|nr:germination protein YpeB [Clostridia bacterium]
MEKKKNNAVEKAEKVVESNQKKSQSNKKSTAKKSVNKEKKKQERLLKRQELKAQREKIKAEKEKALAEKRVEMARVNAQKKAEKQKAKAAALRERNRRKEEKEKRRQELKEQRQARVMADKRVKREQKSRNRQKNKERNKGVGGWIAAVISLGIATLVLASVLTFTFLMPSVQDNLLEANYQKSFYDTVEQVDNIDLNLSKAIATADSGAMQQYLVDTAINSELAENDLQQLPLQDESKYYTTKLINQIGDYAKYLNKKIINGEELTESDYQGLTQLYRANQTLKENLQKMVGGMGNDYSFSSMIDGGKSNLVIEGFSELQNLSVQYPELIYDGPFSDGLTEREIKGLKGEEIDSASAREEFAKIFANYNVEKVQSTGEATAQIECFNVQGEVNGELLYAQISKKGGKLIMFSYAGSCNLVRCDADTATEKAQEFLSSLGIEDMKPVWINLSNNLYTINFAYEKDGVIVYSDLIKVRVCAETEMVIGFEARSYYTNHVERVIATPALSKAQAEDKLSKNIEVDSIRLAVVPIGQSSEKLCYEIAGEYDGSTYYIYIDAISGKQVEMFKVIESTEGTLLM